MRTKLIGGLLAAAALLATADRASAIRWGEPDGGEHPHVGLMVAYDSNLEPMWRCSGTLISPTVYLTAGHCTFGVAHVAIWFDEQATGMQGYPDAYDQSGALNADAIGTPFTHPEYQDAAFFLHDLGVVVLDDAVNVGELGTLPPVDYLDQFFRSGRGDRQRFEVVGYGLQRSMPSQTGLTQAVRDRFKADVRLINDERAFGGANPDDNPYVVYSSNANTGGTCFGDSGGPGFAATDSNMIVTVTSFGVNSTCSGTGGGYRIDQADDLAWINSFLG